jgi:unsaturated rhamnogalacturonyl hydrolase
MFFLLVLISIFLIFVLTDFFFFFKIWSARIKIGRYSSQTEWRKAIFSKSLKWLVNTPTIKKSDNNRYILADILSGNYSKEAIQYWQQAALVLGLGEEYKTTQNPEIKNKIDSFFYSTLSKGQGWKKPITESDGVILAYAFLKISWINHIDYKKAYDEIWQLMLDLKGEHQTVAYKKKNAKFRYVDTIGFICPFLIEYGQKFQVPEAVDLAIAQLEEFNQFAMLNDTFIPCHTYTTETKIPTGLFGWGRGLGWYAIGLIDAWTALENTHPKKQAMTIWVERFAKMAMQFQRKNGSWGWIIMHDNARSDSSTTATLAWFLSKASSIQSIQHESEAAKEKALHYLMKVTRRDGAIDFSQGDTKGIGVHSQEFDILPFTQGFALRSVSHS